MNILHQRLGYTFTDDKLLFIALTHRSVGSANNERFEFLGDALLNLLVAEKLFQDYPAASEGVLSRLRASLVRGETLAELAKELKLDQYLQLGAGEIKSGGANRQSILATTMEAIIGAIYLDGGIEACRRCVLTWLEPRIAMIPGQGVQKDPKTILQERLQAEKMPLPHYKIIAINGKAHMQLFCVECSVVGMTTVAQGEGTSRRKAEQAAAQRFLAALDQPH